LYIQTSQHRGTSFSLENLSNKIKSVKIHSKFKVHHFCLKLSSCDFYLRFVFVFSASFFGLQEDSKVFIACLQIKLDAFKIFKTIVVNKKPAIFFEKRMTFL
jgi:hypothetical protein